MKINELFEARAKDYKEINIKDLVKKAGGIEKIKNDLKGKSADDAYDYMLKVQKELIKDLSDYREIGEVDPTDLMDWCDDRF